MSLGTAMMIYGGCLYMFPTLTIATTVGVISFATTRVLIPVATKSYKLIKHKDN